MKLLKSNSNTEGYKIGIWNLEPKELEGEVAFRETEEADRRADLC